MTDAELEEKAAEILRKPYARVLVPDIEWGGYATYILEFPGCCSEDKTVESAYERLERAASGWLMAALERGIEIPEPRVLTKGYWK